MRQNLLDRAISWVSPRAGYERLRARAAIGASLRHYEGASVGRRTKGWRAPATGPNAALFPSISTLRNRARDLGRNNPWGRRAIRVIKTHVKGPGIRLRIAGPDKQAAELVRRAWNSWAGTTECDADGRLNYYGLQGLALRTIAESGEVLVRRRRRRSRDGLTVPLQLQMLEGDHLDPRREFIDEAGNKTIQGVVFDALGRRQGYWMFPNHPGEHFMMRGNFISQLVPADEVIHAYELDRVGQVRGVPWGVAVLIRLRDLDEFEDATLLKQKIAALFAGFEQDSQFQDDAQELEDGEDVDTIEPGTITKLGPGRTITFASPPASRDYPEYSASQLRAIAAGFGISYEALTGDYSRSNFSSSRMANLEMQGNVQDWQWDLMISQFCEPTWQWFREAADYAGLPVEGIESSWTPPRREMIDPATEVKATRDAVRSGLTTLPEALREQGWEPEEALDEMARFWGEVDERGLVLDSDPRRTTGQGQPTGAAAPEVPAGAAAGDGEEQEPADEGPEPVADPETDPDDGE